MSRFVHPREFTRVIFAVLGATALDVHALPADDQGPPPVAMCVPLLMPVWDPATPYGQTFMEMLKDPPCDDPIWSPKTEQELLARTVAY